MAVLKIALCGDGGVGKTAIRRRYLGEGFKKQYLLTIGADFAMRDDTIDGQPVRYQIWDLAGQERFDTVREVYYKGCIGALLVYDITRHDSFYNTPKWINELWKNNGRGRVPIVVIANKIDLRESEPNSITRQQGETFAHRLTDLTLPSGFVCPYVETSAKTGENIDQAFQLLGSNIMKYLNYRETTKKKRIKAESTQKTHY